MSDINITLSKLEDKHNIKKSTLSGMFKKHGLKVKTNQDRIRFSKNEVLEMYELYKKGYSSLKIAEIYNWNAATVIKYFHKYKLEVRNNKINSKKYICNDSYFKNIDSQDKAYWLGFIYADGYVTAEREHCGRRVGISISSKDRCLLEKFKACINSTNPINTYISTSGYSGHSEYCRILISSDKMATDLIKHGVFENKTDVLQPPSIDNRYIRHFIRGYMDGDGSVVKCKEKNNYGCGFSYSVQFVGTDEILEYIHNYFYENSLINKDLHLSKREPHHIVSYIAYGGNIQALGILQHLYKDANMYLERKHKRYIDLKEYYK